jgi:flagellar biosynthesis/type III secretory pathway protein FliH
MNMSSSAVLASSSPSFSSSSSSSSSLATEDTSVVSPFLYDELSPGSVTRLRANPGAEGSEAPPQTPEAGELAAAGEARTRQLGRDDGLAEARRTFDEQLARERSAIVAALAQFTRDRGAYYTKLEKEVVQLSLAIARKILHREAQVDPLLLAGIARVALEKIEGATGVALRVHPQVAADWERYLASHMDPGDLPEIVEDPALDPERCVLVTSMGTAQLGVEVQLKEIEQGFLDLLAARPQENP